MVIDDLHVVRVRAPPDEADAVLIVDPDAVLSTAIPFECLQPVARRTSEVTKGCRCMEHPELPLCGSLNVCRKVPVSLPVVQLFGFRTSE